MDRKVQIDRTIERQKDIARNIDRQNHRKIESFARNIDRQNPRNNRKVKIETQIDRTLEKQKGIKILHGKLKIQFVKV